MANAPLLASMNASMPYISNLTPLPAWDKVLSIAELYLLYCESQPLPLFCRSDFLGTLGSRDPEIIYAMLALGIRFSESSYGSADELVNIANRYAETARGLVAKRVWEGPVELSTLQCLCILSLVDFTSKGLVSLKFPFQTVLIRYPRWKYASLNNPRELSHEPSSMCKFGLRIQL